MIKASHSHLTLMLAWLPAMAAAVTLGKTKKSTTKRSSMKIYRLTRGENKIEERVI
jgi:hypothetical protein